MHVVQRGPLRIAVREAAELQAAVETEIKSEIEGRTTIIYLIPEGTSVKKGERIVELDVSDLEERRANQGISVERAKASLVNTQQDNEILEKELAAADAQASSQVEIAEIDLEKFLGRPPSKPADTTPSSGPPNAVPVEGGAAPPGGAIVQEPSPAGSADEPEKGTNADMLRSLRDQVAGTPYEELPQKATDLLGQENLDREVGEFGEQIVQQTVDISLARQKLALARDTLDHSIELQKKDYITKNELDGDRLDFESQQSQVQLAWQALDILISYTLRKSKIDLRLKLDNANLNLEKVRADASAKRLRAKAELSSAEKDTSSRSSVSRISTSRSPTPSSAPPPPGSSSTRRWTTAAAR